MSYSVLMSLYDKERPEYLRESLSSIFSQSLSPDEVVIVLDGPVNPALLRVMDDFDRLKIIALQEHVGLGKALNEGLKHCHHDLVARMDTDDICFPHRFECQVHFMEEHPDIDVCSAWMEEFENDIDNVKSIKKLPASHEEISRYIKVRNPINHPTVMFHKSEVIEAGGYQHFPLFEDYYLWARMFVGGARFANIQEPLLYFRTSPDMYHRRGGMKYALNCIRFQWKLRNLGIISIMCAVKSSAIRSFIYMVPNRLRAYIYKHFLRD